MNLAEALAGGDRRSIGRSDEVVEFVAAHPQTFGALIDLLGAADPLVRMRAGDAAEKLSRRQPDWFQPYGGRLLDLAGRTREQELRWHLAQTLPRLGLSPAQRKVAVRLMQDYLGDRSRIVQVFALTALAELARSDPAVRKIAVPLVQQAALSGAASVQARARRLLRQLGVAP